MLMRVNCKNFIGSLVERPSLSNTANVLMKKYICIRLLVFIPGFVFVVNHFSYLRTI